MRRLSMVVLLVLALVGCGGGDNDGEDDNSPRVGIQPVDCKARPERCR